MTTRLAAATLAGGLVALGQVLVPAAATAAPSCPYPAGVATSTHLSIEKSVVEREESNSAQVTVSADAGTPTGTVTLKVRGQKTTKTLVGGQATYDLPTEKRGSYRVSARYNGDGCYRPSADAAFYTVNPNKNDLLGEEAGRNRPGTGTGNVLGTSGGLAATGASANMELLGLLGLGLVGAGAVTLVVYRRRVRA